MKISKNSWHYKLLREKLSVDIGLTYSRPTSLCKYFWMVVFGGLCYLLFVIPGMLFLRLSEHIGPVKWYWFVFISLVSFGALGTGVLSYYLGDDWFEVLYAIGFMALVFGIIVGTILFVMYSTNYGFEFYKKWRKYGKDDGEGYIQQKPKEPNLLIEFLKASKEKTCPIIEFTEPEPEKI